MTKYPDFIRFKDVTGVRSTKCKVNNVHDGLLYAEINGREYIIPYKSVILIIKNYKEEK